ncbi:hypothetical protein [Bordetella ansorpii]|uniref:hypothetical protein n=1 Tax=Bordetella ansorpii TaxID=288768 RepID=UPI0012E7E7A2|nr:hypothetical protein [Bordetella ansorpii]
MALMTGDCRLGHDKDVRTTFAKEIWGFSENPWRRTSLVQMAYFGATWHFYGEK